MEETDSQESPTTVASSIDYEPPELVLCCANQETPELEEVVCPQNDASIASAFYTNVTKVSLSTTLLPHQAEALLWMLNHEDQRGNGGGILADDMGLGKTLDCIALMVKSLEECETLDSPSSGLNRVPMVNLVVVPFSLLPQWKEEVLRHTDALEAAVLIYHGPDRKRSLETFVNAGKGFIVITTYEIVRQEYSCELDRRLASVAGGSSGGRKRHKQYDPSPLFNTTWYRIFLDEAHRIRTQSNTTTKAVCFLLSKRRWCITGTPFNNRIEDLTALAKFVGIAPYNGTHWWSSHRTDYGALCGWVNGHVLNRTKEILNLPTQTLTTVLVDFEKDEQAFYSKIFLDALNQYMQFKKTRGARRFRMFGTILSWLIRLREVCDHPLLMLGRAWTRPYAERSSAGSFYAKEVCCKCKESADDIGYLKELACGHYVCQFCPKQESRCAVCESLVPWITEESVVEDPRASSDRYHLRSKRESKTVTVRRYKPSSKCKAIVGFCEKKLSESEENKIVIFSQWTGFLDLLEYFLKQNDMDILRYDGDIAKVEDRDDVIKEFKTVESCKIILCSLQCGGLGLNLTVANIAILADSWYNPFLEKQAVDRVHRIGQTKPVEVVRFLINKSIEVDVSRIQERKKVTALKILSGMGMKRVSGTGMTEISDNASGLSEMDVHEIFRRTSSAFVARKNPVKRPREEREEQGKVAKKRGDIFAHFAQRTAASDSC